MAFLQIPQEFANRSTDEIVAQAGTGALPLIPPGKYTGLFLSSEMKPTQTGGQMLVMKGVITQGEYKDTELTERLNLVNSNTVAVKIAYETLAKIAKAAGHSSIPSDSNLLHNKPMIFVVETEKGTSYTDKATGEARVGRDRSRLASYEPMPKTGLAGAPAPASPTSLPWQS